MPPFDAVPGIHLQNLLTLEICYRDLSRVSSTDTTCTPPIHHARELGPKMLADDKMRDPSILQIETTMKTTKHCERNSI
jgi:hypothetical protein